jgi:phthiocerol/phenolphthiocerol synthesis type-I polyketide synthase E
MTVNRKKDIAVIGISGMFPKSANINEFWNNLIEGKELIEFLDKERQDKILSGNPHYVPAISRVENEDKFDYNFFGYTDEEAKYMDPQVRIMHQQVYRALDDAGYIEGDNQITGLYLSSSDNLNWRIFEMLYPGGKASKFLTEKYANKEFISTLISYKLGLKGPSFYTDTACSSSLATVHMACRALLLKECELAVAGGVSVRSIDSKGYLYEGGMIASKDGHCRAFDEKASGTVWGEGAGAVVLKRYEDAVRDKDYIYAVVKSTFVNNDGKRKVGYSAPSVSGQAECIKTALRIAELKASEIDYIEAHGTGTKIGDPIELEALNEAFEFDKNAKCAIGSVKSNMGHLDAAAGIAGFIKTCLILNKKQIPPSINFDTPNPEINFQGGPFYVNTKLQNCEPKNDLFRAGVSSFGIGGTNCHAILEEHSNSVEKNINPINAFFLSAKTEKSLKLYKESLVDFIGRSEDNIVQQISYSVNNKTSKKYPYRDYIVFHNKENAVPKLQLLKKITPNAMAKNVVFLFPGQGSQYFGMGKDLYDNLVVFKDIMDQGFEILSATSNIDFKSVLGYGENTIVDQDIINNTLYTQPILFLIEYALAKTIMSFGISPNCMIGHSLGEYVAACLADVITFEDALKIVFKRAQLMNSAKPGVMIAVLETAENVKKTVSGEFSIAAVNTTKSCVIACDEVGKLDIISQLEKSNTGFAILKTSHAFHSFMMDDILDDFRNELVKINFSTPKVPMVSNLTGNIWDENEIVTTEYWVKHLRNAVLFEKGINQVLQKWPDAVFIEVGPGKALSNFLNDISEKETVTISMLRNKRENVNDYEQWLNSLGVLWSCGHNVKIEYLYDTKWAKIPVPGYVFDEASIPARINVLEVLNNKSGGFTGIVNGDFNSLFQESATLFESPLNEENEFSSDEAFRLRLSTEYAEPENSTQQGLVTIWKTFFGNKPIGIKDNFLDLGGDSLKAMSIVNAINKEFDFELTLPELYESPTIEEISAKIEVTIKFKNIINTPQAQTKKIKI